jgi:hypothetical protein
LSDFDHWIKEDKGVRYYIRYCDDGVVFHRDKTEITALRREIEEYMRDKLKLTPNPKTRIFDVDRQGIDFLGYRCFRDHTLLRKSSARNFKKKMKRIETHHVDPVGVISSVMSYIGWMNHCDSYNLMSRYIFENPVKLSKIDYASHFMKIKNPLNVCIKMEANRARIYNLSS